MATHGTVVSRGGGLAHVMSAESADILRDLLTFERDRLLNDHYDDDTDAACDGCARLARVVTLLRRLDPR